MKKIAKEPLIHFLLIGAFLFLIYSVSKGRIAKDEIIIDNAVLNDLSAKWEMQWKREPNSQELVKLVGLYINQEVLYKEALAMNLDHNDEIIKRRLAKKMEFISDDLAESLQPSEKKLSTYYEENRENYARPPIYTFSQLFFKDYAKAVLASTSDSPQDLSDKLSMPSTYNNVDQLKISIDFGKSFASSLDTLETNKWAGPIKSGYGNHLVFINEKRASGYYKFEEVANKVLLDYNFFASEEFKMELISTLLKNYELSFELEDDSLKEKLIEAY